MDVLISNGVRGQALKQYLNAVHFDSEGSKQSLLKAMDKNSKDGIDELEAAQALPFLKTYNLDNVKVLTQAEVSKMIRAMSFNKLSDLGTVWDIPDTDYEMVIVTKPSVDRLGIDLDKVFALGSNSVSYKVGAEDGYLRHLNLTQTVNLLRGLVEINPEIGVGLPNLGLAKEMHKVFVEHIKAGDFAGDTPKWLLKNKDGLVYSSVHTFWTGDIYRESYLTPAEIEHQMKMDRAGVFFPPLSDAEISQSKKNSEKPGVAAVGVLSSSDKYLIWDVVDRKAIPATADVKFNGYFSVLVLVARKKSPSQR
jgi:hypothetical protein